MNNLLLSHRPKDLNEEQFKKLWENASYTLEPLYKAIKDLVPSDKITRDQLLNPNMYATMVYNQAQKDLAKQILDLFPKSLTL
jgi:hypothetical protein